VSKESVQKKIQRKAARRNDRRLPASDQLDDVELAGNELTGVVFDEAEGLDDGSESPE